MIVVIKARYMIVVIKASYKPSYFSDVNIGHMTKILVPLYLFIYSFGR